MCSAIATPPIAMSERIFLWTKKCSNVYDTESQNTFYEWMERQYSSFPTLPDTSGRLCPACSDLAADIFGKSGHRRNKVSHALVAILGHISSYSLCPGCIFFASTCHMNLTNNHELGIYFIAALSPKLLTQPTKSPYVRDILLVSTDPDTAILSTVKHPWDYDGQMFLRMKSSSLDLLESQKPCLLGPRDYQALYKWLRKCIQSHKGDCSHHSSPLAFNLNVIDCQTGTIVRAPSGAKYLALSYVWGPDMPLDSSKTHRNLSQARAVIRDAMEVTLKLHFRYLWIDRYCIDQGDDAEKHRQIMNMNHVFAGSTLTIIAAAGMDPDFGLPGVSSRLFAAAPMFKLGAHTLVPSLQDPKSEIKLSKWASRGWTYQEAILSPRKLVFTMTQAYVQCNREHWFGLHHHLGIGQSIWSRIAATEAQSFDDWGIPGVRYTPRTVVFPSHGRIALSGLSKTVERFYDHIRNYLTRDLSFESDRLNAIQGVLNYFKGGTPPLFHIWGIAYAVSENFSINHSLFWHSENKAKHRRPGFPSWSWVGWDFGSGSPPKSITPGPLNLLRLDKFCALISAETEDGHLTNITAASFVRSYANSIPIDTSWTRFLTIEGCCFPFTFLSTNADQGVLSELVSPFGCKTRASVLLDDPKDQSAELCIVLDQAKGVVMGRFGIAIRFLIIREDGENWIRCGVGEVKYFSNDASHSVQTEEIRTIYATVMPIFERKTFRLA